MYAHARYFKRADAVEAIERFHNKASLPGTAPGQVIQVQPAFTHTSSSADSGSGGSGGSGSFSDSGGGGGGSNGGALVYDVKTVGKLFVGMVPKDATVRRPPPRCCFRPRSCLPRVRRVPCGARFLWHRSPEAIVLFFYFIFCGRRVRSQVTQLSEVFAPFGPLLEVVVLYNDVGKSKARPLLLVVVLSLVYSFVPTSPSVVRIREPFAFLASPLLLAGFPLPRPG